MITRNSSNQIEGYWQQSDSPELTAAARLELKLKAFQMMMTAVVTGVDGVQRVWDNTGLLVKLLAAEEGGALDEGGTVTKEAWVKYQTLFISFRTWLNTPVSANLPTGTLDANGVMITFLSELEETPAMLIMRKPEKVTP